MSAINIYISPNETSHKDRMQALQNAIMRHPDNWVYHEREMGIDLVFESEDNKFLAVEIKMPADYAESCRNGHMATQRRGSQYPLRVAVLGTLGDVMRSLTMVNGNGYKSKKERILDEKAVLRWTASLKASGVDVSFGMSVDDYRGKRIDYSPNLDEEALEANMGQILREAKAYLEGDYHLPMPKCESPQEAMLQCLPGVGPQRAKDLIEAGIKSILVCEEESNGRRYIPISDKELVSVSGIGKVIASNILETME